MCRDVISTVSFISEPSSVVGFKLFKSHLWTRKEKLLNCEKIFIPASQCYRETKIKKSIFSHKIKWSDKVLNGAVVNQSCRSKKGGSLKFLSTVP